MNEPTGTAQPADAGQVDRPVGRPDFMEQIEACRRSVARWPDWMRQEVAVPPWMANHATDL